MTPQHNSAPTSTDLLHFTMMVVLLEVSPVSTQDLWSSARVIIGYLGTSLTKALIPQMLSLVGGEALGRALVVANFSQ